MLKVEFIKPRGEVLFEPDFSNPDFPIQDEEYYAGLLSDRFQNATRIDIHSSGLRIIPTEWLLVITGEEGGHMGGPVELENTDTYTALTLPKRTGFLNFTGLGLDNGRSVEPIIIPLHATTVSFSVRLSNGMFASAGIATSEADRLVVDAPETMHHVFLPAVPIRYPAKA